MMFKFTSYLSTTHSFTTPVFLIRGTVIPWCIQNELWFRNHESCHEPYVIRESFINDLCIYYLLNYLSTVTLKILSFDNL